MQKEQNNTVTKEDNVRISSYSELMNNYFPESSIEGGKEIRTLMVGPDQPLVFYQDKGSKLNAILRKEGSESGWVKIPLSKNSVKSYEFEYNKEEENLPKLKIIKFGYHKLCL